MAKAKKVASSPAASPPLAHRAAAFDLVSAMEDPLVDIEGLQHCLSHMDDLVGDHATLAIHTVARLMGERLEEVMDKRNRLFHLLHKDKYPTT
jgi:hypothetical protein